jgi:hypothetical protein
VRFRLLLCLLPLGVFTTGCHHSKVKANTGADVEGDASGDSGSGGPAGKAPPDPVRPGIPTVTFPGFEVLPDGRSVITVQSTGPTSVSEQKAEGRLIYTLQGVAVPYKVNKLPLVTTNFPTQVSRVEVDQISGGGANVIIDLREPSTATFATSKIEGGTLLTITLPRSEKYGSTAPGGISQGANWDDAEGGPRRRHKKSDTGTNDVVNADKDTTTDAKARTKRADRQPIPYVERHITLSYMTLAPDIGISLFGGGSGNPNVWLSSGLRWGIIDQIEVEATPHSFRFAPNAGYAEPSVGATFAFFRLDVEMAGRLRFFIPIDSSSRVVSPPSDPILEASLPFIFHLGHLAKIDTGINVSMDFKSPISAGLTERLPSPLVEEPGIPLKLVFNPVPAFWLGFSTGYECARFDQAAETSFIPVGLQAGITTSTEKHPTADFGVRFDLPRLFSPGLPGSDKIQEDVYSFAAWLRWYYYI